MPISTHLIEGNYPKAFPPNLDQFPTVINEEHYIDAWLLNSVFNSLIATEQYLIEYKDNIEAPLGGDIVGADGQLEISIPPARYPNYKTAMAWDSNLLSENIKSGETIFGVSGTLALGGGIGIAIAQMMVTPILIPPTSTLDGTTPAISVPSMVVS